MDRDFAPAAAWRLSLDSRDLVWTGTVNGDTVRLDKDPGSSWRDRFLWSIMRLPFERL